MNSNRFIMAIVGIAAGLLSASQCIHAEPQQSVPFNSSGHASIHARGVSFVDALEMVSRQTGLQIIADGEPGIKKANIDVTGTAAEVLAKVADTFDYTIKPGRNHTFILVKRFWSPDSLPQTHLNEMRRMAADIISILGDDIKPRLLLGHDFRALYNSLSEGQQATVKNGGRLPYDELSTEQQSVVRQLALTDGYGEAFTAVKLLYSQLYGLKTSSLQTVTSEFPVPHVAGYPDQILRKIELQYCWTNRNGAKRSSPLDHKQEFVDAPAVTPAGKDAKP